MTKGSPVTILENFNHLWQLRCIYLVTTASSVEEVLFNHVWSLSQKILDPECLSKDITGGLVQPSNTAAVFSLEGPVFALEEDQTCLYPVNDMSWSCYSDKIQ